MRRRNTKRRRRRKRRKRKRKRKRRKMQMIMPREGDNLDDEQRKAVGEVARMICSTWGVI